MANSTEPDGDAVSFRVLGPVAVSVNGIDLQLGGTKPRALLALLLTELNRPVATGRIIEALWGQDAPDRAPSTLQVHVSNLRKSLAPAASSLADGELLRTQAPGYAIHADAATLDLSIFRALSAEGQAHARRGDHRAASNKFSAALNLVTGEPIADLLDEPFVTPVRAHLNQIIANARAARIETELALGRHREILHEIESSVAANPFDEHLRSLHMLALYRCGRQADALGAYQIARNVLVEELGVDPSPVLRELEKRILEHDPTLLFSERQPFKNEFSTVLRSSVLIPSAVLIIESEQDRVVRLEQPTTTIGRSEGNDIVLDDTQVSRLHAEVRVDAGMFHIVDKRSTNGTVVNGSRHDEHRLQVDDVITIGRHRLRFALLDR